MMLVTLTIPIWVAIDMGIFYNCHLKCLITLLTFAWKETSCQRIGFRREPSQDCDFECACFGGALAFVLHAVHAGPPCSPSGLGWHE